MKTVACVLAIVVGFWSTSAFATDYYVATYGIDATTNGLGTNSPFATLGYAVGRVSAGDTIYMRGGTYATSSQINMTAIGSSNSCYTVTNFPGEVPVLNCSGQSGSSEGIRITGAYWQLYGLVITNAAHNGINIRGGTTAMMGSFNRIERCVVVGNRDSGLLIGSNSGTFTALPSSNTIVNCDAIRNFDSPVGGNADGFSVKWTGGPGNKFIGCRSWENSDDGWDLWMTKNPVLIDTCWTWRNGSNVWGSGSFNGNGNGFKLGGSYVAAAHRLVRSVAYQNVGNGGKGIDQNNNTAGLIIDNNTSWGNPTNDINLNTTPTTAGVHVVRNNLVISGTTNIQSSATQISNSWQVITYPGAGTNDVLSLDASFLAAPRQADGSLPITPLVRPVPNGPNGRLVDKGAIITNFFNNPSGIVEPFYGSAPDLGAYEAVVLTWRGDGVSNLWNSGVSTNWFDGQRLVAFTNAAYVTFDNTGSNSPAINLVGTLCPSSVTVTSTQNYTFGGTGSLGGWMMSLVKSGTGQLTVTTSNTFGGGTTVSNGTLLVNNTAGSGTGTGAVTVVSGATLGGSGTIGGPVTVNGTLTPGNGVGTLTISNTLVVNGGAVLQYALGTSSDLTAVSSNLTLGGTLNITDAGGFTNTTYRLFNYGGTLTYNGLTVGTKPNTNFIYTVSTGTVGQVNLVVENCATSPGANFTAGPTNGVEPLAVSFTDTSTGTPPLSLSWDLGDSTATNTAGGASFGHTYTAGTYAVTLLASNSAGTSTLVSNNLITVVTVFQAWQTLYFGCTNCPQADVSADPDGDGLNNQAEFQAGTNPTNSLSGLRIISAVSQGNDLVITWTTAGGRTNAVQATAGDVNGGYNTNFADITTPPHVIISGNGDVTTNYQDVGGATNVPSRYYRIRLVP